MSTIGRPMPSLAAYFRAAKAEQARKKPRLSKDARALLEAEKRALFLKMLVLAGLPAPTFEYQFHPSRKWRFDAAWVEHRVALEVDGAVFKKGGGRHTRGTGWLKDTEKLNAAAVLGWRMLRCTPQALNTLELIDTIAAALTPTTSPP